MTYARVIACLILFIVVCAMGWIERQESQSEDPTGEMGD